MRLLFTVLIILLLSIGSFAQSAKDSWKSVGPDGGDVRTLSADPANPERILLGTSAGQIYQSEDGGKSWQRFVRIGKGNDYVIDHIIFNPKQFGVIYVAAWTLEKEGGSVFRSTDNGHSWEPMPALEGKSVRAMAMAASDPDTLVIGALDGIFRSSDAGKSWDRISPASSNEIKNIESIAIDPSNPAIIYAGTWHLPWKTIDGGKTWQNIKNGIIDDSDVFSIIIDPSHPQIVYASACSGIYKSESAGEVFRKIQGIPFSARRTRVLKQDPEHTEVVYAGTTEGLWKTSDAGKTWRRITGSDVIVNDVMVDSRNRERVMLATDRSGVLASSNAGASFQASNSGFAHRQVSAIAVDPDNQNTLYTGLINDKQYGGVFVSRDGGVQWKQMSSGLNGRDVFALRKAGDRLLAGTSNGVFVLDHDDHWRALDRIANAKLVTIRKATRTRKALTRKQIKLDSLKARVTDLQIDGKRWIAASTQGLFMSSNLGQSWQGGPVLGHSDFTHIRFGPKLMIAAGRNFLLTSYDSGESWLEIKLPGIITSINDIAFAPGDSIWLACREGLYVSRDSGSTWERLLKLPVVDLASVVYDSDSRRMLVTAMNSTEVFSSEDDGKSWQHHDTGWLLRTILDNQGRLLASTAFDGVVIEAAHTDSAQASMVGSNH